MKRENGKVFLFRDRKQCEQIYVHRFSYRKILLNCFIEFPCRALLRFPLVFIGLEDWFVMMSTRDLTRIVFAKFDATAEISLKLLFRI